MKRNTLHFCKADLPKEFRYAAKTPGIFLVTGVQQRRDKFRTVFKMPQTEFNVFGIAMRRFQYTQPVLIQQFKTATQSFFRIRHMGDHVKKRNNIDRRDFLRRHFQRIPIDNHGMCDGRSDVAGVTTGFHPQSLLYPRFSRTFRKIPHPEPQSSQLFSGVAPRREALSIISEKRASR